MKDQHEATGDAMPHDGEAVEGFVRCDGGLCVPEDEGLKTVLDLALSLGLHARPVTKQETGMRLQAVEVWGEALHGHYMRDVPVESTT